MSAAGSPKPTSRGEVARELLGGSATMMHTSLRILHQCGADELSTVLDSIADLRTEPPEIRGGSRPI